MKAIFTFKFKHKKPIWQELLENKDEEIERLTDESTKWESKFYDEAKKVDKAIEELEIWKPKEKILQEEKEYLLDILKGLDKE